MRHFHGNLLTRSLRLICLLALVALVASPVAACPQCKNALASSGGGGDWVSGFMWSILFMLSMPFTLVGSFGLYAYVLVRRARAGAAPNALPGAAEASRYPHDDHSTSAPASDEALVLT